MNIAAFISVFFVAASKFLFAPTLSLKFFTFWETILFVSIGGIAGVSFFFFGAKTLVEFTTKRKHRKEALLREKGIAIKQKKVFTPFRRRIIRIKRSFGLTGFAIVTPCIISIPIGSIITARFYHHKPQAVFALYLSVIAWAFILTYFNDIIGSLFR